MSFPNYAAFAVAVGAIVLFISIWKFRKTRSQKFLFWLLIPVSLVSLTMGFSPIIAKDNPGGLLLVTLAIVAMLVIPVLIYFGLAGLIGDLAKSKGRSWAAFFWLSVLLSPIILWIVAAAIAPIHNPDSVPDSALSPAANAATDIANEIEKLGSLKEQGLITEAEFDSKKKELLGRM